jgi:hypothetical protein
MSATKQKPTIESLISIGFAVVIVIGIAPVIFWQQDREQPSAPVNDEQLKPEILQLHVVEGPKPSETPTIAAETPPTQEYDTDLPANLLDGAVAKVYEVAE